MTRSIEQANNYETLSDSNVFSPSGIDAEVMIDELDGWEKEKVTKEDIAKEQAIWIFDDKKLAKEYLTLVMRKANNTLIEKEDISRLQRFEKYRIDCLEFVGGYISNSADYNRVKDNPKASTGLYLAISQAPADMTLDANQIAVRVLGKEAVNIFKATHLLESHEFDPVE